uniref:Uncharacterized protein n=1 Tax=Triticum urartu TaxID=4572 RepID=A0A8R7Q3H4_TRIUA
MLLDLLEQLTCPPAVIHHRLGTVDQQRVQAPASTNLSVLLTSASTSSLQSLRPLLLFSIGWSCSPVVVSSLFVGKNFFASSMPLRKAVLKMSVLNSPLASNSKLRTSSTPLNFKMPELGECMSLAKAPPWSAIKVEAGMLEERIWAKGRWALRSAGLSSSMSSSSSMRICAILGSAR